MSQSFEAFGKYILLEKLATGGMAEVYLAKNNGAGGIGKLVAIKRILPQYSENPEFIDMFKDEAKIAVNLAHSNVVSIHEFGVEREQFFLVMDFVEGRNLRQILNKMKKSGLSFSVEQVLYVIKEVAAGLDSAHRCLDRSSGKPLNITHRDMSPQNVMISFEGEVKVVDFGIAKAETQIENTRAGTLKGKFGYMSPEQAEGQVVDLRTDVFSLGIVLWELLANDRLFVANNEINTLRKIRDCQIPSLRKINPNIPAELERICNKSLARDRNLRYQTAAAFHRELSRFLNRQFPDFSPHDFSVFIKTLFAGEILDHRKKIVDYSRVDATGQMAPAAGASTPNSPSSGKQPERTQATRTEYESPPQADERTVNTESNAFLGDQDPVSAKAKVAQKAAPAPAVSVPDGPPKTAEPKRPVAAKEPKLAAKKKEGDMHDLEFAKLRVDHSNRSSGLRLDTTGAHEGSFAAGTMTGYRRPGRYGHTSTNTRIEQSLSSYLPSSAGVAAVGLMIIVALAFYIYSPTKTKETVQKFALAIGLGGQTENSSETPQKDHITRSADKIAIGVSTFPPLAEIWLDGVQLKDVTPTTIHVEPDREYQITLYREFYDKIEMRRTFTRSGEKISAKFLEKRMASIDVIVEGNGEIWINDKKRATHGPLIRAEIPANEDVVVRAYDPQTGAEAIERVRLGEGFHKPVRLYPKIMSRTGMDSHMPFDRSR